MTINTKTLRRIKDMCTKKLGNLDKTFLKGKQPELLLVIQLK